LLSERSARQSLARKRPDFGPFSKGEKAKEDRRFESPSLQQRGAANRCANSSGPWPASVTNAIELAAMRGTDLKSSSSSFRLWIFRSDAACLIEAGGL